MEHGIPHHLHLSSPPVARMDTQASVVGSEEGPGLRLAGLDRSRWLPVGSDIGLDAMEKRLRGADYRAVLAPDRSVPSENELHLPGVAAPRPQQRVGRQRRGGVIDSSYSRRRAGRDL